MTEVRVEVKGTVSQGDTILLTGGEAGHARQHLPNIALFKIHVYQPWQVDRGALSLYAFVHSPYPVARQEARVRSGRHHYMNGGVAPDTPNEPQEMAAIAAESLVRWAAASGRTPAWRDADGPYPLAVAEILLQKTKAQDAEAIWRIVMQTYSGPCDLAAAQDTEIEHLIGCLGLRRQRTGRLKAMAAALCRGGGGKIPGLGPYASAIIALSAGADPVAPPVDGNIARVISRFHGLTFERGEPRKKPAVKEAVQALLSAGEEARDKLKTVYALVDLGATVCTPRIPSCSACPLVRYCRSAPTGCG